MGTNADSVQTIKQDITIIGGTVEEALQSGSQSLTRVINSALLDRIQLCTAVNYMSVPEQRKVLKNTLTDEDGVCHATEKEMDNMIAIMAGVNEAFLGGRLADSMSMRGLLSFAKLACMIGNKGLAFYTVVVNKVDSTEDRDVLLSIARTRGGDDYVYMV